MLRVFTFVLILALAVFVYLTRYYYRDLILGPPVDFDEDDNIEIGLYPNNYQSAVIFTCDDVNATTKLLNIKKVLATVEKHGVKAVFFVIPFLKGRHILLKSSTVPKMLKAAEHRGHEVAMHGLTHLSPTRRFPFFRRAKELGSLPYGEQKRRIKKGIRIMRAAGFNISGFRSPAFSSSIGTLRILDSQDLAYTSDTRIRPIMLMSNKRFCESLYYPYHPQDLSILDFTTNGDYFWGYSKLGSEDLIGMKRRFNKFYDKHGVFVLLSHIDPINSGGGLKLLNDFLKHVDRKNVWKPNLREAAAWWSAREVLFAESEVVGDTLNITLEKGSELPMRGLTIKFKPLQGVEKYKITLNDTLIKKGRISERVVLVDI